MKKEDGTVSAQIIDTSWRKGTYGSLLVYYQTHFVPWQCIWQTVSIRVISEYNLIALLSGNASCFPKADPCKLYITYKNNKTLPNIQVCIIIGRISSTLCCLNYYRMAAGPILDNDKYSLNQKSSCTFSMRPEWQFLCAFTKFYFYKII